MQAVYGGLAALVFSLVSYNCLKTWTTFLEIKSTYTYIKNNIFLQYTVPVDDKS